MPCPWTPPGSLSRTIPPLFEQLTLHSHSPCQVQHILPGCWTPARLLLHLRSSSCCVWAGFGFAAWASGCLLYADDAAWLASSGDDFGPALERQTAECDALDCCGVLIKDIPSEEERLLALKNTHCYVENRQTCRKAAMH